MTVYSLMYNCQIPKDSAVHSPLQLCMQPSVAWWGWTQGRASSLDELYHQAVYPKRTRFSDLLTRKCSVINSCSLPLSPPFFPICNNTSLSLPVRNFFFHTSYNLIRWDTSFFYSQTYFLRLNLKDHFLE